MRDVNRLPAVIRHLVIIVVSESHTNDIQLENEEEEINEIETQQT